MTNGRIVLTSLCEQNEKCKIAWTHIITLEIKAEKSSEIQSLPTPQTKLSLNSFEGGSCNESPENCLFDFDNIPAKTCSGN